MKVFRKIRFTKIRENKIVSFLIYSIGEILLVIMGILIALAINNYNDKQKNDVRITNIYKEILKDLEKDILAAENVIIFYETKDTLVDNVISDKISKDDYIKNPNYFYLFSSYSSLLINDNNYKNLIRNQEYMPEKYNKSVLFLDELYVANKNSIDLLNEKLGNQTFKLLSKWSENYEWFLEWNKGAVNDNMLDYFLNNYKYKNEVLLFQIVTIKNFLPSLRNYKRNAEKSYKEIYSIIHKSKDYPMFLIDKVIDLSKYKYSGLYKAKNNFEIEIFKVDKKFYARAKGQEKFEIIAKSELNFESELELEGIYLEFRLNSLNKINEIIINQKGTKLKLLKVKQ